MNVDNGEALDGFIDALLDDDAEQLYQRAPCGYLSTTPDGTIVKVNETFLALSGYARAELVGRRRFVDLLSAGGRIYHETHYAPMLRMHGAVREIALDLVRRDETRLPVLVNAALDRDEHGEPVIVRTAVFDATHRREYERELLRAKERAEVSEAHATALARTLQETLIPPSPPQIPGLDIAATYRPAGDGTEVGGDLYDVFQVGVDDWVVVIGDVCGKGVEAAVVTSLVRHTLRAAAVQAERPADALRVLNDDLLRHPSQRFCTVVLLRLRRMAGEWSGQVAAAGHPLPVLRQPDGALRPVGTPGSLLGVLDAPELHDEPITLRPGDALLLYTDGVPEARAGDRFYGESGITAVAGGAHDTATSLVDALLLDVLEFQGGLARDDIAIVAVRVPESG